MRKTTTRAAAILVALPLAACSAGPATPSQASPSSGATPFTAPQAASIASSLDVPPPAVQPAEEVTVRSWGVGRRTNDLGAAVHAALPVAVAHLGSAARTHVHVEAVEAPTPGAAVVVVLGLEVAGGEVRSTRVGVPVVLVAGRWHAGRPWALPAGTQATLEAASLDALPADDPALRTAAVGALADAGWVDVVVQQVAIGVDTWPHVVTFTATSTDGLRRSHTVWLRRHLDDLVVAGLPVPIDSPSPDRQPTTTAARQQEDTP